MSTAYSTFSSKAWNHFKQHYKERTEDNFQEWANHFDVSRMSRLSYELNAVELACLFSWKFKQIDHYFLDAGVADFCASSVKEFSKEYCKRLPEKMFAIHFPAKERSRSVIVWPSAFIPRYDNANEDYLYFACASDGEFGVAMQQEMKSFDSSDNDGGIWMAKLLFGFSLYIDAFPDVIVPAGSDSIHKIKHYDGTKSIIRRNEVIDEEHKYTISPHWRRGHFRLLSSEKFTKKHGQTVYVRGSFVKGHAFDVLNDSPKETT